jgi:hypothetical protein
MAVGGDLLKMRGDELSRDIHDELATFRRFPRPPLKKTLARRAHRVRSGRSKRR